MNVNTHCCGLCIYGKNQNKYPEGNHLECMIRGYEKKNMNDSCSNFSRDFKKNLVVKQI